MLFSGAMKRGEVTRSMKSRLVRLTHTIDAWPKGWTVAAIVSSVLVWALLTYLLVRAGLLSTGTTRRQFTDLFERFRDVASVLHDGDLYAIRSGSSLNTNPPIVVLVMGPISALGKSVGAFVWTTANVSSLVAVATICARRLSGVSTRSAALIASLVTPGTALLLSDPYRVVLLVGQVRVLLLFLVVMDLLAVRKERRGILVGLASAMSLTPMVFILLIGLSAGRRAVFRCLVATAGFSLLGLFAGAAAWWRYYAVLLPTGQQLDRVLRHRSPSDAGQANLRAVFARPPLAHMPIHQTLFAVVTAVVVIAGLWIVFRVARSNLPITALMSLGFLVTIVEPESWVHSWVWALLGPFAAWELLPWRRSAAWGTLLFLVPMLPVSRLVAAKLGLIEQLASSYTIGAMAFLALIALCLLRAGGVSGRDDVASSADAGCGRLNPT